MSAETSLVATFCDDVADGGLFVDVESITMCSLMGGVAVRCCFMGFKTIPHYNSSTKP